MSQHNIKTSGIAPVMAEPFRAQCAGAAELVPAQTHWAQLTQSRSDAADLERQIAQIIRTAACAETLLSGVATAVGQAFQADGCLVAVQQSLNSATTQTLHAYPCRLQAVLSEVAIPRAGAPLSALGRAEGELLAIGDLEATSEQGCRLDVWQALQVRAVLGIRTQFQGQVNGEIIVMRAQPYCWTDPERELLKSVSDSVAIAISQVVHNREIGSLQGQVSAFAQHRTLINQLTVAIHNALDLNQIFQMAIDGIAQTLRVARGAILMLKYADPLFATRQPAAQAKRIPKAKATIVCQVLGAGEGPERANPQPQPAGAISNQSFWLSECALFQQAFTEAPRPLAIPNFGEAIGADSQLSVASIFTPEVMPALLLVPLVGGTSKGPAAATVLGFLLLQHSQPRLWAAEELELVELVGAQLSTAIIQSQTIQHVQALVEERTSQLQRSLEVQAKLYEKTRQQIDQLRRLNQLKDEFLSTMSHELRTPLTSMTLAIRMLRQPGLPAEKRDRYLDILEQQCNQETNLINDLLALQKLESQKVPVHVEKIDIKDLIAELVQSFEESWADKGLKLAVDLPKLSLKLQTDRDSLQRILQELLTNAGKYSAPGTTAVLRGYHQSYQNIPQIVLSLSNTGPGISPEELPYIFDKFRRGQGVTDQAIAGTGLGLALVKCLVGHVNGAIEVSSSPLEGSTSWETCFTLTLPQILDTTKV
ncbi:ATP-binding protein [Kamptonema formosum]|uniref:ATP-binding protein n=1 Tax=Kamptonema formosum TaxID=331992 RepID=UPI0004764815|nr:ATP-binding protein [Oscillatoria sp. PCC 10802]